jgi:hypothetical protein
MRNMIKLYILALVIIVISSNHIYAKDLHNECNTQTHTIMENGKIIKETIIKKCDENIQLNQKSFVKTVLTEEEYETFLIMTFIFLLENIL